MIAARPPSARPPRRAVTLLELILVLCLLVALSAMAWPLLERPLANRRLRAAADTVRAAWGDARLEAMSSGETVLFQCAVDGDSYSISFRSSPDSLWGMASAGGFESLSSQGERMSPGCESEGRLPEGVTFASSETAASSVSGLSGDDAALGTAPVVGLPAEPLDGEGTAWSDPIVFYPDGSATDAHLVLQNEHDRCIKVSLRGLTAVATVGGQYSAQEFLP